VPFFCCDSFDYWRHLATAKSPILRRHIAAYCSLPLICRFFFSCCDSAASPQEAVFCADEAGNIYSVLLLICQVPFSCCDSFAWPQAMVRAPAWATRSRTCDAQSKHRPEHRDQVRATHSERRRGRRPRQHGQVLAMQKERRRGQRPGHHDQVPVTKKSAGSHLAATTKYVRGVFLVLIKNTLAYILFCFGSSKNISVESRKPIPLSPCVLFASAAQKIFLHKIRKLYNVCPPFPSRRGSVSNKTQVPPAHL